MIYIEIKGGQGNQMFQYALGRKLSIMENTIIRYDMSYFRQNDARGFILNQFNTVGQVCSGGVLHNLLNSLRDSRKRKLLKILSKIGALQYFNETSSRFNPSVLSIVSKNIYLSGYWASYKYFDSIKELLKDEFKLKNDLSQNSQKWLNDIVSKKNTVSLHVRRGDYLNSEINRKIYKELPLKYYWNSIDKIIELYGKVHVYIFSNDIEWTKEHFVDNDKCIFHYVDANDEEHGYEDMHLMWHCEHHIIANSTFSWWGAYLSKNDGLVFAPSEWFNIKGDAYDISDYYPEKWTIVDV